MTIAVCVKWVTSVPGDDDRFAGISPADAAAVEWALRCADAWDDAVTVVTCGPAAAEAALRTALAAGAQSAVRIDLSLEVDSALAAAAMAPVLEGCRAIWCGDYSLDRGSGSVPALLAALLGAEQALGIVDVAIDDGADASTGGALSLLRRLDGGRRERLRSRPHHDRPVVVSVEGSTARLRRASLRATMTATEAAVEVRAPGAIALAAEVVPPALRPYRPRARALPAPEGETALERLRRLTDAATGSTRGETVELEPDAAADRIIAALSEWGEF